MAEYKIYPLTSGRSSSLDIIQQYFLFAFLSKKLMQDVIRLNDSFTFDPSQFQASLPCSENQITTTQGQSFDCSTLTIVTTELKE